MTPAARILIFWLSICLSLFFFSGCTVKLAPLEPGMIPKISSPTPEESEYGERLFQSLLDDHELASSHERYEQLTTAFDHLVKTAEVDHLAWQLHVFEDPEIVDVRAVHGNYIFVWSGFLDIARTEGEIAGVLAGEMAHALARHTEPVQFTLSTDIFFSVAEMATSVAIMAASHGIVAVSGNGWMKWAYVHAADLDPLDREYNEDYEKEAAALALLLMTHSKYSPQAMVDFWKRLEIADAYPDKDMRLNRDLTPQQRVLMLEEIMPQIPEWSRQENESKEG